jgi:hypothetical protein
MLNGVVMALTTINQDELDRARCAEWAADLRESLASIATFADSLAGKGCE